MFVCWYLYSDTRAGVVLLMTVWIVQQHIGLAKNLAAYDLWIEHHVLQLPQREEIKDLRPYTP